MKSRPTMTQSDVIEEGAVTDPAGVKYEQDQRALLEKSAAEARAFLAKSRVEERTAPAPTANPKATAKRHAALEDRLARLADQINVAKVNITTAEQAETLAKAQREADAATLRMEEERLKQEATAVQLELERLEAVALADAVAAEQATTHRPELADAPTWRAMLKADLEPMVTAAVAAVVKLRELLSERGPVLDKIASLQADETMPPHVAQQYAGVASKARQIKALIANAIADTQTVLNRAAKWEPQYWTEDIGRACHLLQRDLERVSSVVVRPRAFTDTRAGMKATPATEPPAVVSGYQQQVNDVLATYRSVQKVADEAKGQPSREVVIHVTPNKYWEDRRRKKVGDALRGPAPSVTPDRAGLRDLGIDPDAPPSGF